MHHIRAALGADVGLLGDFKRHAGGLTDLFFAGYLVGHHRGELDHLVEFALSIVDRVVGCFQPDLTPAAVDTFEAPGYELATVEHRPELPVRRLRGFCRIAEDTVMLALDLRQAVTHAAQELIVGSQYLAAQVELDHGGGAQQCLNKRRVLGSGLDDLGDVRSVALQRHQSALLIQHRLPEGANPYQPAIGMQKTVPVDDRLALLHRHFETAVAIQLFDVSRHQVVEILAQHLLERVAKRTEKVVVGVDDVVAGVQSQTDHLRIHPFLHLPVHG